MRTSRILSPVGAIISLGFLAAIWRAYRRDIRRAHARVSTGSLTVNTERGLIEYASIGKGVPLLVVHGAGGGFDQVLDFATGLNLTQFHCIFVSRFGYLRTPLPSDGSPEAQADLYACLLDSLGISEAAIIGVSAGGPSALQFAIRHPQRCLALVLLVPATFAPDGAGIHSSSLGAMRLLVDTVLKSNFGFWLMTHLARRTVIENILGTPFEVAKHAIPADRERLRTMMINILPLSRRRAGLFNDGCVISGLTRFDLDRIEAPTLLISTEDDRYGTYPGAQYTAGQIRNARFIGFSTGGHLWLGHNEEVSTIVRDFLQEVGGSKSRVPRVVSTAGF